MPAMPKEICGPDQPLVAIIKFKRDAVNTEIGAKRNTKRKILKNWKKNDGIALHYHETGHAIDFENTQIIAEEKHTGKDW